MKKCDLLMEYLKQLEYSIHEIHENININDEIEEIFPEARRKLSGITAGISQMLEDEQRRAIPSGVDFEGVLGRIQSKIAEIEKIMNVCQREW